MGKMFVLVVLVWGGHLFVIVCFTKCVCVCAAGVSAVVTHRESNPFLYGTSVTLFPVCQNVTCHKGMFLLLFGNALVILYY